MVALWVEESAVRLCAARRLGDIVAGRVPSPGVRVRAVELSTGGSVPAGGAGGSLARR